MGQSMTGGGAAVPDRFAGLLPPGGSVALMATEADLTRRLVALEQRVDYLFGHLKVDAQQMGRDADLAPAVRALIDCGDKPAAITLVCEQTGMGQAEAKRTVEQIMGGS